MNQEQQRFFLFLVSELGGENKAKRRFYAENIKDFRKSNGTFEEMLAQADEEGWGDVLREMPVKEFYAMCRGDEQAHPEIITLPKFSGERKRMTKEEKEKLHNDILAYLDGHSWVSAKQIAEHAGVKTRIVGLQLKQLRAEGYVQAEGEKTQMRYALAGELLGSGSGRGNGGGNGVDVAPEQLEIPSETTDSI